MVKYPKEKIISGLYYNLISTHDTKTSAKMEVFKMKRKTKTNIWGITSKVSISTRIIKSKDDRWLVYARDT